MRASLEIDDPAKAGSAIEAVYRHFEVAEKGSRNRLSGGESMNGYRDAKFNVKLPDGSPGEV